MNLFISYGSRTGQKIGELIKQEIEALFNPPGQTKRVICFVAKRDLTPGQNWFSELAQAISDSDIGLFLLDKAYAGSIWMNYELGALQRGDDKPIFPLVFNTETVKDISGPFSHTHLRLYNRDSYFELVELVKQHTDIGLHDIDSKQGRSWDLLSAAIADVTRVLKSEKLKEDFFTKELNNLLKEYEPSALETDPMHSVIAGILNISHRDMIIDLFAGLTEAFIKIDAYRNQEDQWLAIMPEFADRSLLRTVAQITDIALSSRIVLETRDDARNFWKQKVLKFAKSSIVTTNLPGTFGRQVSDDVINAQRKAIEDKNLKDLTITRLFIYDPNNEEDLDRLNRAIAKQLEINVQVSVIDQSILNFTLGNLKQHIRSLDFMIIDDSYVYITNADEPYSVEFTSNPVVLDFAKQLWDEMISDSEPIEDMSELPWLK